MAEEEKKDENSEEEEKEEKSSGGGNNIVLILIVVLLVLVLAVIGIGAYVMLSGDDQENPETVKQEKVEKKTRRKSDDLTVGPMYPLDKFTVNLLSENGRRFLVAKINLEEDSEELTPELDKKTPLIRDIIISILSSKTVEEITTPKGKEKLKEEIVNQINKYLEDGEIANVYFTEFVIQ
ncbi:flagellar basal body-associated protein FliL [Hydrogenimonas thermophila]|uniref:Flagellar protein FliL n=1 Tax=Hydrogenimonas thermophila TaxID=223786 RepID=A0A1I5U5H7_9BACT|nr:flagellar basal body-associated protein FliL [Hydrogenimonas thermophila]WOE68858.1 flagellar basal body-associated protein FliL [Hydrogenimonas thermophila]WOE71366.1 flagellar basal body-associated protein FliL [Hydrogenimonas thermophila]SFP90565.1 flagellar FliL protein [Hydrogenimonas thermophila]